MKLEKLLSKKPVDVLLAQAAEQGTHTLKRGLGAFNLTTLGVGAIIGAGIFVLTGHAAHQHAGPAIVLSFMVAGLVCALAALCYAELASMIPVAGSAYTYTFATVGELFAWIIAWDLIVEYLFAAATVSVGWSGYFVGLMGDLGLDIPAIWTSAPFTVTEGHHVVRNMVEIADGSGASVLARAILNLPASLVIGFVAFILILGVTESAWFNTAVVALKVGIVVLVILFGLAHVDAALWRPLIPPETTNAATGVTAYGIGGMFAAAGVIFFAYIGFEAVSCAAQEAHNPQRNMPIGILGSLAICTVLYILMSLVITGIVPYTDPRLADAKPIYHVVDSMGPGYAWLKFMVTIGATIGLGSTILVLLYGQSRIFYAMSRDGLLPPVFSRIHPKFRTPWMGTIITAVAAGLMGGLFPIGLLGELVSVGTLLAFALICGCVLYLRVFRPELKRSFRAPVVWLTAPLGMLSCFYLIASLPQATFARLVVWMAVGLVIYASYAYWHSRYHESKAARETKPSPSPAE